MRTLIVLFALTCGGPAAAQVPLLPWPDRLPADRVEPRTDSAPLAFAASVGATVGLVGLGAVLAVALPEEVYVAGRSYYPNEVGYFLIAAGVIGGPMAGNYLLGARDDLTRSVTTKAIGMLPGVAISSGGLLLLVPCALSGSGCDGALTLMVAGAVVGGIGVASGMVYDLVTIPRNAARAREALDARRPVEVGLAPVGGRPGVFAVVPL